MKKTILEILGVIDRDFWGSGDEFKTIAQKLKKIYI